MPLKPLGENHIYERDYNENFVIHKVVLDHHHLHHEWMVVSSSNCQTMPCHAMTRALLSEKNSQFPKQAYNLSNVIRESKCQKHLSMVRRVNDCYELKT